MHKLSLHIFRRDLRLEDNSALLYALKNSEKVIPAFILDKRQLENNPYRSDNALSFMFNSLMELDAELKKVSSRLYLFYGIAEEIADQLLSSLPITLITINRDYTPFAIKRDRKIEEACRRHNASFISAPDTLLNEPETVHKDDGKPFTIFTFFARKASKLPISKVVKNTYRNYYSANISHSNDISILNEVTPKPNTQILLHGGRHEALNLLNNIYRLNNYTELRDYPIENGTSNLSAHNKFGTISIRELYHKAADNFGESHQLITELYWRDFFTHIAYHFPHVFGNSYHQKYDEIKWSGNMKHFEAWKRGETGFPIVDAGMRELNTTGYMHNRVRMVTASFLVKDLHIDWRLGEQYFAQKLIDYDPSVNNGNWQWAASTGTDSQPYFRIFNPWNQQKRFDSECLYIKRWIPELRDLTSKEIQNIGKKRPSTKLAYPPPIINHKQASAQTKEIFRNL